MKATVASVLKNSEARESDLYIFVDGARHNKDGEVENVTEVQNYVKTISGFKSIHYDFAKQNKGLGPSIIAGVTEVINLYGRTIVLEDDLILASNCLSFMNQGLEKYENEKKVYSICGYSNKVKVPKDYSADSYFCVRSSSWGWATWSDRWNSVDWELKNWDEYAEKKIDFNKWGGSDCFSMLQGWKNGSNKSWAIRFCFNQFLQGRFSLFPLLSKIHNNGFGTEATNCTNKYNRFKFEFDKSNNKSFVFPLSLEMNKKLYKSAMKYHSLTMRLWSKIIYTLER